MPSKHKEGATLPLIILEPGWGINGLYIGLGLSNWVGKSGSRRPVSLGKVGLALEYFAYLFFSIKSAS